MQLAKPERGGTSLSSTPAAAGLAKMIRRSSLRRSCTDARRFMTCPRASSCHTRSVTTRSPSVSLSTSTVREVQSMREPRTGAAALIYVVGAGAAECGHHHLLDNTRPQLVAQRHIVGRGSGSCKGRVPARLRQDRSIDVHVAGSVLVPERRGELPGRRAVQ